MNKSLAINSHSSMTLRGGDFENIVGKKKLSCKLPRPNCWFADTSENVRSWIKTLLYYPFPKQTLVFSSTGWRPASYCHGVVSAVRPLVRPSVCASVNSSFKKLLLRNYGLDFYKISQECSLDGPLSNSFK